jgi:hypothetical protein
MGITYTSTFTDNSLSSIHGWLTESLTFTEHVQETKHMRLNNKMIEIVQYISLSRRRETGQFDRGQR